MLKFNKFPLGLAFDTKTNRSNEKILSIAVKFINSKYETKESFLYLG